MAGYQAVEHSSGGRNGVAILVRDALAVADVVTGLADQPNAEEARWIEGTVGEIGIASAYVPNGRSLADPAFTDKLTFLNRLVARAEKWRDRPAIIAGDFNIAPGDLDVYDPARYLDSTHTSPEERRTLTDLAAMGYVDVFRQLQAEHPTVHLVGLSRRQLPQEPRHADRFVHGQPSPVHTDPHLRHGP